MTENELVAKCVQLLVPTIMTGEIPKLIENVKQIIAIGVEWHKTNTVKESVLLCEDKVDTTPATPEVPLTSATSAASAPVNAIQPAPLYNKVTSSPVNPKTGAAHVGPSKVTTGWSNPFQGTSWGV